MKKLYIIELSVIVAILNMLDGIFTSYGISQNLIEELNPFMRQLTSFSPALFLTIKFFLSISIVYIAFKIFKIGNIRFKKWFYFGLISVFIVYSGIVSIHLYWISLI